MLAVGDAYVVAAPCVICICVAGHVMLYTVDGVGGASDSATFVDAPLEAEDTVRVFTVLLVEE